MPFGFSATDYPTNNGETVTFGLEIKKFAPPAPKSVAEGDKKGGKTEKRGGKNGQRVQAAKRR